MTPPAQLALSAAGDVPIAVLDGEVDMGNAGELRDSMLAGVGNQAPGLILDLSRTTYLDSAGVHVVFDLARRLRARQQELRVVVPAGAPIRRVLVLTNVSAAAPLHESLDEAVAGVGVRGKPEPPA